MVILRSYVVHAPLKISTEVDGPTLDLAFGPPTHGRPRTLGLPDLQPTMVRVPTRTHSVSGPPSVHSILKGISCCCDLVKFHQFQLALMALRRNPKRKCRKEDPVVDVENDSSITVEDINVDPSSTVDTSRKYQRKSTKSRQVYANTGQPFRFCDLPREIRDHVYSYLVVCRQRKTSVVEAKAILRSQKKRASAQRTRERLNEKRAQAGRPPISPRGSAADPFIHSNILLTSKQLYHEAGDCMYQNNWFAISLDNFCYTDIKSTIDAPLSWDFSKITRMQIELQLKDSQRMNRYINWGSLFSAFSTLRFLRIIPTFHPRYYDWAHSELKTWESTHFVFRAFFRELLASIPGNINLKLGPSPCPEDDMQLEGRCHISTRLLRKMYLEIGKRRGIDTREHEGRDVSVGRAVECGEVVDGK
ncbi:hypothetical protein K469DRAFT_399487 [Zopfia rhizophila CBS 207.26]|uniref:F-box domain-containing protein n=1 Tax=Zopfia rhizophila CBS 207.26 TaxID=1314779 RepID=A0A6A6DF66_9PEZI|nr:hypothetical protein K469DRAFT_399487 [Zopfia rhizophila CBS 207.26]